MEIYKKILHHPNYEISNYGNVRNAITGKLLKATTHRRQGRNNKTTYLRIELKEPRSKHMIHRLVMEAFVENPNSYTSINHKDENGLNNHISNLEWCTHLYNCVYSQGKRVKQLTPSGELLNIFDSLSGAGRKTGSCFKLISAVCLGKRKTHNGYVWQFN